MKNCFFCVCETSCRELGKKMAYVSTDNAQFCSNVRNVTNRDDVTAIIKEQKQMLQNLEKSNQMLLNCNRIAEKQQEILLGRIQHHTLVLVDMKKDLNSIFSRIRNLKLKLQSRSSESWLVVGETHEKVT
uniref:KxDL motif-containing protein 1 n=1 Tax=Phallusia mammillata TaxID=59560 RepID=A0A6F9DFF0_9ASCI|nr:kxDL motif-containing protein 1-like [Phallusia mammillata]